MRAAVRFFVEDIDFKFSHSKATTTWLHRVAVSHGVKIKEINYIFVSDQYLLRLNQNYLQHDTLTDIITFPYDEEARQELGGDIYISIERIQENAAKFGVSFENELSRVMVHGLLHLVGFEDTNSQAKKDMRRAEDAALDMLGS